MLAGIRVEGHCLDRAAHRLGHPVHRLVGELDWLELRVRAFGGDESSRRVLRIPGDHGIRGDAGELTADGKAVRSVNYCIHGREDCEVIYTIPALQQKMQTLRDSLIATFITARSNESGRYRSTAPALVGSGPSRCP